MIYIKSNEHNIINNYNDKVKMILRSRLEVECEEAAEEQCDEYEDRELTSKAVSTVSE